MKDKLRLKSCEIQVLLDCREKLESRLNGMAVERERQHYQILRLVRVKADLTEELDHQQEAIQDYKDIKKELLRMKKFLTLQASEVSGLQTEREALHKEIATMKDEIGVRKVEVSMKSRISVCTYIHICSRNNFIFKNTWNVKYSISIKVLKTYLLIYQSLPLVIKSMLCLWKLGIYSQGRF